MAKKFKPEVEVTLKVTVQLNEQEVRGLSLFVSAYADHFLKFCQTQEPRLAAYEVDTQVFLDKVKEEFPAIIDNINRIKKATKFE